MDLAIKEKTREPGVCGGERKQHKERHMVSWSQQVPLSLSDSPCLVIYLSIYFSTLLFQEDDLLREQVEVQGIDK